MIRRLGHSILWAIAGLPLITANVSAQLAPTQIGDTIGFNIPFGNDANNDSDLKNVRPSVLSAPAWLTLKNTSVLIPLDLPPGESMVYRLDFDVAADPDFSPAEVVVEILTDTSGLNAPRFVWHFRTSNGFATSSAEALDEQGNSYGGAISEDRVPPFTDAFFIGPTFVNGAGTLFIATHTAVGVEGIDQIVEDAVVSEVAFTGFLVDQSASDISELDSFVSTFTLSEGAHFVVFASSDFAANVEQLRVSSLTVDGTAPGPPQDFRAEGSTGSSRWQNVSTYMLTWIFPSEVSGIGKTFVQIDGGAETSTGPVTVFLADLAPSPIQGATPVFVRLEDNVENVDPAQTAGVSLRFDNMKSTTSAVAPSTAAAAFPVTFVSNETGASGPFPTASGVAETVLWFRRIATNQQCSSTSGAWTPAALPAFAGNGEGFDLSTGTFSFNPVQGDGKYCFFIQAQDVAGNLIPDPGIDTPSATETLVDGTPPVISNVNLPFISSDRAELAWTTDDPTTALVEYGTSTLFGRQVQSSTFSTSHKVALDCSLLSPDRIYYRITSTNRTELVTVDGVRSFDTLFDATVPVDIFDVVDLTEPIQINVTNPELNSISITLGDGTPLSTSLVLPEGVEILRAQLDGLTFNAIFPLERLTAPGDLPFVISGGGQPSDSGPGGSAAEFTIGEVLTGAPSDTDADGALASGQSKLFAGFWSRIDPVLPGNVIGLQALTGPGTGQVMLSWTAPGDDAGAGTAMQYDLRTATNPITADNFLRAARISTVSVPVEGGQVQNLILAGLAENTTFFFALKAVDELLNVSPAAAFAGTRTLAPAEPPSPPPPFVEIVELPPGIEEPPPPPTLEVQVGENIVLSGPQTLTVSLNGFVFQTHFVIDTATRSVRLARLVIDGGGVFTSTETTPGSSIANLTVGQSAVGPPMDVSALGAMSSPASRMFLGYFAAIDPVAPGAVTNLSALRSDRGEITLSWTAPGDDAYVGTAMQYDLRYATEPITEVNFEDAAAVALSTFPALNGTQQGAVVGSLADGATYFFALKTKDELLNFSTASFVAIKTFEVAESTDFLAGSPVLELLSSVSGIGVDVVTTTGGVPAVALATSAAAAQGLVFASNIYDIASPLSPPLPGGGTIRFRYDPTGLTPSEVQSLRVYHFDPAQAQWIELAEAIFAPDNLIVSPVVSLSFFAILMPDEAAPVTVLNLEGGRRFIASAGNVFASTSTRFRLSARDPPAGRFAGTGVSRTEFRVDAAAGPFTPLDSLQPLIELPAGLHTIQYRSADFAGNIEPVKGAAMAVDGAPPTAILSSPEFTVSLADGLVILATAAAGGGKPELIVELRDPLVPGGPLGQGAGVSTVSFAVDGGSFTLAASSFTVALSTGSHILALAAEDNVGNLLDLSTTPFRIVVGEILAPRTSLAVGSPNVLFEGRTFLTRDTPLTFSSVDDFAHAGDAAGLGAAFQEVLVGGLLRERFDNPAPRPGQVFVSSLSLASDPDGPVELSFFAEDAAGNRETVSVSSVVVDNGAPDITVLSPLGGEVFIAVVSSIPVGFTLTDAFDPAPSSAAFLVQVENKGLLRGPTVFAVHNGDFVDPLAVDDGLWRLELRAEDFLGNASTAVSGVFEVIHDIRPPRTTLAIGEPKAPPLTISVPSSGAVTFITRASPLAFSSIDDLITVGDGTGLGVSFQDIGVGGVLRTRFANPFPRPGQVFTSTLTFAADPDGLFEFSYLAEDVINNSEGVNLSSVAVDNSAPETRLLLSGPLFTDPAGRRFIAAGTSVAFAGADVVAGGVASGLARILFNVNSGALTPFVSTFTLTEGIQQLGRQGIDQLGNTEPVKLDDLRVDATPPITELAPSQPFFVDSLGRQFANSQNIYRLEVQDPLSAQVASGVSSTSLRIVPLTVSSGVVSPPSPQDLADIPFSLFDASTGTFQLSEGAFRPEFQSEDRVLNRELLNATSIFVDAAPPVSTLNVGRPQFAPGDGKPLVVSTATPFTITAVDPEPEGFASGVENTRFRLGGGAFQDFTGAFTLGPPDGDTTLGVRSRDNVGNLETETTRAFTLDGSPPVLALISPPRELSGVCSIVGGSFPVLGSVRDPHLKEFRLEFAPGRDAVAGFVLIGSGTVQVGSGALAVWDTTGLSGFATLRLSAADQVGNGSFIAANVFVGEPKTLLSLGDKNLFDDPEGVAVDSDLNLYVADTDNDRVAVFSSTGGLLASFGGEDDEHHKHDEHEEDEEEKSGLNLKDPADVAVDDAKNIYIADTDNHRIVKLSSAGVILLEIGKVEVKGGKKKKFKKGDGPGEFKKPSGVALDASANIYVSDTDNRRVQVFDSDGTFLRQFLLPAAPPEKDDDDDDEDHKENGDEDEDDDEGPELGKPMGIAVDSAGNIYVADRTGHRALKFDAQGGLLLEIGSEGSAPGRFNKPMGIAVSPDGQCILVSDRNRNRIQKFDSHGKLTLVFGVKGKIKKDKLLPDHAVFDKPRGLALDFQGNLYVADRGNDRVVKMGIEGELLIVRGPSKKKDEDEDDEKEEHLVRKSEGGKVKHSKKKVEVDIPVDALEEDLIVSIEPGKHAPHGRVKASFLPAGVENPEDLKPLGEGVEFGPEGTRFSRPVTISLPYDPARVGDESALVLAYWNPAAQAWEPMPGWVDYAAKVVRAHTNHFSLYAVMGVPAAGAEFRLGEVYVKPNPAAHGAVPVFHIEAGVADRVKIRVFNIAGQLGDEIEMTGAPQVVDDGQGPQYAYEYPWRKRIPSGMYLYTVEVEKAGYGKLRAAGRFAVVR